MVRSHPRALEDEVNDSPPANGCRRRRLAGRESIIAHKMDINKIKQHLEKNWAKYLIPLALILLGMKLPGLKQNLLEYYNSSRLKSSAALLISPRVNRNKEVSAWYSVEYPTNFFVSSKTEDRFEVAAERWFGKTGHLPVAGIQVYTDVIPQGMSLREWLNGVGDPNPPIGEVEKVKSCKEFVERIGLGYKRLSGCLFYGVNIVGETTVAGLPAVEFNTQNVSAGAVHTIAAYQNQAGQMLLFDIYYTITGMSEPGIEKEPAQAYKMFLQTFDISL